MVNRKYLAMACAALLVAAGLEVAAQTSPTPGSAAVPPTGAPGSAAVPATGAPSGRRFQHLDVDHDGRLSRSEAAKSNYLSKHFDEVDTNHDGYITPDEKRQAWKARMAARNKAHPLQPGSAQRMPSPSDSRPGPVAGAPGAAAPSASN